MPVSPSMVSGRVVAGGDNHPFSQRVCTYLSLGRILVLNLNVRDGGMTMGTPLTI